MHKLRPLILIWILTSLLPYEANAADQAQERLALEVRGLFAVIAEGQSERERCTLLNKWSEEPIPTYIAAQAFGLKVHAAPIADFDLTQTVSLKEIIDPANRNPAAFCDHDERNKVREEGNAKFKSGAIDSYSHRAVSYTFPIFNHSFNKAVLIVTSGSTGGNHSGIGGKVNWWASLYQTARIYSKVAGKWRLVNEIETASAH